MSAFCCILGIVVGIHAIKRRSYALGIANIAVGVVNGVFALIRP